MALLTIDLEDWNHGLHIPKADHSSIDCVWYLQYKLCKHKIKATFYVLGKFSEECPGMVDSLKLDGHTIKSHGYYHYHYEESNRQPYANLGMTGGFYFRFFPYSIIRKIVEFSGHLYLHPHDLDENHPRLKNPFMNWKRHVGLKGARAKLERLLSEVKFDDPA